MKQQNIYPQGRGNSIDALYIEKREIHMKHEPREKFRDTNGCNSVNFSCLGQETNRAGFFQVREILWETLHNPFSCHLFWPSNRYMTKVLTNKLRDILFRQGTGSWDNNIPVSLRVEFYNFDVKIVQIVLSLAVISKNKIQGQQSHNVQEVHIEKTETNIKFRAPDEMVLEGRPRQ